MKFFSICLNMETQLTSNYGVACRRRLHGHRPWSSAHENGPANTASCGLPLESHTQTAVSQGPLACPSPNQHLLQQQTPINSAPCPGRRRSLRRRVCVPKSQGLLMVASAPLLQVMNWQLSSTSLSVSPGEFLSTDYP